MLKCRYKEDDTLLECGIDEAGRGCLWGPLIAGAVLWHPESEWTDEHREISQQIKDSKKLSPKKRAVLRVAIQNLAIDYAVGRVEASEIDTLGMTRANCLAFERAVRNLSVEPDRLLVDGILSLNTSLEQVVEPEMDAKYIPVAAASILAKEVHDEILRDFCETDSTLQDKYDLLHCKGYGTATHRKGITTHGTHPQHRRLFLRKLLGIHMEEEKGGYGFLDV
jgi:ribonuclease HII